MKTNLSQLLYLLMFLAPVSFLFGYMMGAPRPAVRDYRMQDIDTRTLPVSPIDFYRNEGSMVVETKPWIRPNSEALKR